MINPTKEESSLIIWLLLINSPKQILMSLSFIESVKMGECVCVAAFDRKYSRAIWGKTIFAGNWRSLLQSNIRFTALWREAFERRNYDLCAWW